MSFFKRNKKLSAKEALSKRQEKVKKDWIVDDCPQLFNTSFDIERVSKTNCENLIGSVEVPLGLAGPVKIISREKGEFFLPLATSEGALVASTNRGVKAINQMNGAKVFSKKIGMSRAPVFALKNAEEAFAFQEFMELASSQEKVKEITEATSSHLKFKSLKSWVRGRNVYLRFVFDTDEAMGMNMVTIALKSLWDQFLSSYEGLEMLSISGNLCVDKKDSVINRLLGRGYFTQSEVFLSKEVLQEVLKSTADEMMRTHQAKNLVGSNLAGSFSQNMQAANIVAAFFLATGQDMAHVVEASQATTIFEKEKDGLFVSVTMPNINLGTVGGGTWLESQAEARTLIAKKKITARQLAEVLVVAVMAAEISGMAALGSKTLTKAHQDLARK